MSQRARRTAVFLDRDGVLNCPLIRHGAPHPPSSVGELELLPGVREACAALRGAGFLLIVVTNQPDVARGIQNRSAVEAINGELCKQVRVDDVRTCFHDERDGCACRKPAPGLLLEAARLWDVDLAVSVMVGDRWRDVEAGRRAGCSTVFLDRGYREQRPEAPDLTVASLPEAVPWILERIHQRKEG